MNQIRLAFGTYSYDVLLANDDSIIEDWPYAPVGRKWRVESDGILTPYVRRDPGLGASERGQGLLNFSIRIMDVTRYGYSWLRYDPDNFAGKFIKRATVFVPNDDYPISPDTGYVEEGLDEQWVAVQCEIRLWNITPELPRRRALFNGARFLTLEIQCINGLISPAPPE